MTLFEILPITAVVLVFLAGVLHMMGKETEAKWLFRIGLFAFVLLWLLLKAGFDLIKDENKKTRRYD